MEAPNRHLWLLVPLLSVLCALNNAAGQDCPCSSFGAEWLGGDDSTLHGYGLCESPSGEFGAYGVGNNMAACIGPFCGYACRAEGLTFSTDLILMDVWQRSGSDIAARLLALQSRMAPPIDNLNTRIDASPSITFGYVTCEGLGFQTRYFNFDTVASRALTGVPNTTATLATHTWDVNVFDLEAVYSSIYRQVWDITLSGGYRFAEYEEFAQLRDANNAQLASVRSRYVGNGVTGAVQVRRQITNHWSVMAIPRFSVLLGNNSITGTPVPPNPLSIGFDTRYTLEAKLGLSYEIPLCGGGVWFNRAGYEVQYWNDAVPLIDAQSRQASTNLSGVFFAVGIQR